MEAAVAAPVGLPAGAVFVTVVFFVVTPRLANFYAFEPECSVRQHPTISVQERANVTKQSKNATKILGFLIGSNLPCSGRKTSMVRLRWHKLPHSLESAHRSSDKIGPLVSQCA
jgi:hypothetical protein